MKQCRGAFALLALCGVGEALLVDRRPGRQADDKVYVQTLRNYMNMQYFADINIGGQRVDGIFDTGSSQLLVRSAGCSKCKHPTVPYDSLQSKTYKKNGTKAKHYYGSGMTVSLKGWDEVKVGTLVSPKQSFWQIIDHQMPILDTAKFAAIVGIGPDNSFGNTDSTLLMSFGIKEFSVCLKRESGADGYLTWGPTVTPQYKEWYYAKANVMGEHHWSVRMNDVTAGKKGESHLASTPCMGTGCAAIVDSGTSLIAAPTWALIQLSMQIPPVKEDCSNMKDLPTLHFQLNGTSFSLPPRAYVMRIKGASLEADSAWDILFFKPKMRKIDMCMPAFMQMDMMSDHGPVWILGMPFFREYHTTFNRVTKELHFAKAGPDCYPHPFYPNGTDAFLEKPKDEQDPEEPFDVDLSLLVPPTLSGMIDLPKGGKMVL